MSQIDEHAITNKDKILGKYSKLYKYQSIVRQPMELDELSEITGDDDAPKKKDDGKVKFDFCKIKLDIDFDTKNITTSVFVKDSPTSKSVRKDVKTAKDLEEYHTFGSTVRYVLTANKLWAAKNKNDAGERKYGVSFKILQMEIIPKEKHASTKEIFSKYNYFSGRADDEEEEEEEDTIASNSIELPNNNTGDDPLDENSPNVNEDEDNEEDENEADQEAEAEAEPEPEPEPLPEPTPTKKPNTRKNKSTR